MGKEIKKFTLEEYMNLPDDSFELYQTTGDNRIGDVFARQIWKEKVKEGHHPIYMEIIEILDSHGNYKDAWSQVDTNLTRGPDEIVPKIKMVLKMGKII